MTIEDVMDLFLQGEEQVIEVYSSKKVEAVFKGFYGNISCDYAKAEILSIENLNHRGALILNIL